MRGDHSGRPSVRQSAHPRPLDQRDNWRPEEYSGPAENVAYSGAGKKRTHCRDNIAHVIMFPKCCLVLPRAQHLWRTQILCPGHKKKCLWKSSETFLASARCATTCPRFAGTLHCILTWWPTFVSPFVRLSTHLSFHLVIHPCTRYSYIMEWVSEL